MLTFAWVTTWSFVFTSSFAFFSAMDWDPLCIIWMLYTNNKTASYNFFFNLVGKLSRTLFWAAITPFIYANIRTFVLIQITIAPSYMTLEKILLGCQVSHNVIFLYKQLYVERRIFYLYEKFTLIAFFVGFTGALYVALIALNIGTLRNRPMFVILALMTGLPALGFVAIVLQICTTVCERSISIVQNWKVGKGGTIDRVYKKRVLRSLWPLTVPAGGMGIIDRKSKVKYFDALLYSIVNLQLGVDSLVSKFL